MFKLLRQLTSFFSLILIIFGIFAASRALIRALPGDPLLTLLGETGTSLPIELIQDEFHLNRPFLPALIEDTRNALKGDLGLSLLTREPIAPLLLQRLSKTIQLTFFSLAIALMISLPLGLLAALYPGKRLDQICTLFGGLTAALPLPWIGPIFLYFFVVVLPLFPVGGSVILPSLTLGIHFSGLWARLIRERVRETLLLGAAPGARARGIQEWKVLLKYGLAPCSGALIAYLGTQAGALLGGTFVTEVIFSWKGMGSLLVESILKRDYPIVEAAIFVSASTCLLGTYLGDQVQTFVESRGRN